MVVLIYIQSDKPEVESLVTRIKSKLTSETTRGSKK
jgi:hypothetical protein